MLGLILCGGLSTRMGSDKGLLVHQSETWAQLAAGKLAKLDMLVRFSVNETQLAYYADLIDKDLLIADDPSLTLKGPLLGVLSAHVKYPDEDLFVLACDLLLMDVAVLQQLVLNYKNQQNFEAFIYTNNNQPEPLCAIYTAKGLAKTLALQQAGELQKFSMKYMLSQLSVYSIPVKEDQVEYFQNFNVHAGLNGL